jgi:histidinol-phosphatase
LNPEWKSRYDAALEAVSRSGPLALHYFEQALNVEWKEDESPVTVADRETETVLRQALCSAFPQDGFLGEEYGDQPGTSGFRWIIDPIDGTRNFVRGIPIWATLVGLEYRGERIAGIVDIPTLRQTYHALRGEGAYRGDKRIRVSDVDTLGQAVLYYTSLSWFLKAGLEQAFLEIVRRTYMQRGFGDFWPYVLIAQGSGDVMLEHGVHAWDVAAIQPLVEEAGGRFSNWDGGADIFKPDVIVTNGKLHEEVLGIIRSQRAG